MFLAETSSNSTVAAPVMYLSSSPLIYFPPEVAYQINVATYIHIGCLAVILWDVIDNIKGDFKLLFYHKLKLPTVIYFISRVTLLAYMITRAILLTLPVANCGRIYNALNALLVVFVSATTAMFYLRVCAVYTMNKYIVVSYGLLWLGVVGMLLTLPETFTAIHLTPTQYCTETIIAPFLGPTTVILMINDTLVYAAIAYKIFSMFVSTNSLNGTKVKTVLTFGTSLPIVSRALFKDSQLYFMVVLVTNPFIVACVYVFEGTPISVMFLVCHLVVVNILSCRVYRNIRMSFAPDVAMPRGQPGFPNSQNGQVVYVNAVTVNDRHLGEVSMDPTIVPGSAHGKEFELSSHGSSVHAPERDWTSTYGDVEQAQRHGQH